MQARLRALRRRAALYRYLARAFSYPDPEILAWIRRVGFPAGCQVPLPTLEEMRATYGGLMLCQGPEGAVASPLHECSYTPEGRLAAPQEMADVAGFYRAFGMGLPAGQDRPDHLCLEVDFVACLLSLEEQALARGWKERASICRRALRTFLRDHLGRWTAPLAERLTRLVPGSIYPALASLLATLVAQDMHRLGVRPRPAAFRADPDQPLAPEDPLTCPLTPCPGGCP
ncbi:MAG TPA: molecular chaperone TorD family protein [Candidatus Nitrosotenuis sp.]|nr:molecular chaperone TorD family protein [Candidatus Nitrosotenuis sp.]